MQINKQRLQLWLDEKVAAYNNGSSQDIEMIRELCKYSKDDCIPQGLFDFYANTETCWYQLDTPDRMPHQPVSWFFEAEEAISNQYQGLFDLMYSNHNLILTITEMDEIIREVNKINK